MDRTAADDTMSGVAAKGDTLYRRPPAHPPAESMTGGSWFTDGTELPEDSPAGVPSHTPPQYGPATPAGTGRGSYGFTAGPISPVRHGPTSAPPAPSPFAESSFVESSFAQSPEVSSPRISYPAQPAAPAEPAASSRSARRHAEAVPQVSSSWPPPARLTPDQDALDRVPGGTSGALRGPSGALPDQSGALRGPSGALRAPSGEYAGRRYETGERRVVQREVPPPAEALPPRQSRAVTVGIAVLSAIVLVAGSIVGVVYFSGSDEKVDSVLQLGAGNLGKRTISAPLDNRTKGSFELLAGANTVHLTIGELGDDLYRISTPDDAGILPSAAIRGDDVKLQTTQDGDGTGGEIEVVLAAKVRWQLRFSGYAESQNIDVSGGQISGIEMVAGMREAQLTLSRPTGTVPVKINGAVDKLVLKSPEDNPVRIKVGGGAQTVNAGTRTLENLVAGSTLTPKDWNTTDRYDVTAGARITSLTVENG